MMDRSTVVQDEHALAILRAILTVTAQTNDAVDAVDFRADHEDWIPELDRLERGQWIKRENGNYRVTFMSLVYLQGDIASCELERCRAIFDVLRKHYKDKKTRNQHKFLKDISTETKLTFPEVAHAVTYLLDVSHLWCGGWTTLTDEHSFSVLPSEGIIQQKSFDEVVTKTKEQFIQINNAKHHQLREIRDSSESARTSDQEGMLSPDAVVLSFLSRVNADSIVEVVSRAGLNVDWALTEKDSYSSRTRIRAYLPRIQTALCALDRRPKLVATEVLIRELVAAQPELERELSIALMETGWTLNGGVLAPSNAPLKEHFFSKGSEHDAYVRLREIVTAAKSKLCIIDPYVDGTLFTMLRANPSTNMAVEVLTAKFPPDFSLEREKFSKQFPSMNIQVRKTQEFHDRFVVVDERLWYHVGASIKDAGGKAFMLSQIEDRDNIQALKNQFLNSWKTAVVVAN